jgi:hypothetical protein
MPMGSWSRSRPGVRRYGRWDALEQADELAAHVAAAPMMPASMVARPPIEGCRGGGRWSLSWSPDDTWALASATLCHSWSTHERARSRTGRQTSRTSPSPTASVLSTIELRTTDTPTSSRSLLRLREAGAEVVTINTFPATKKGEGEDITRVFDIELRDLSAVEAKRIAESVPGVRVAGARPTLGQIFGKRVIVVGGGAQVAQVALGAVSESDRQPPRRAHLGGHDGPRGLRTSLPR